MCLTNSEQKTERHRGVLSFYVSVDLNRVSHSCEQVRGQSSACVTCPVRTPPNSLPVPQSSLWPPQEAWAVRDPIGHLAPPQCPVQLPDLINKGEHLCDIHQPGLGRVPAPGPQPYLSAWHSIICLPTKTQGGRRGVCVVRGGRAAGHIPGFMVSFLCFPDPGWRLIKY